MTLFRHQVSSLRRPISAARLNNQSDPKWTITSDGLLRYSDRIYVPDHGNLRLRVLQFSHDHPLAGHFGQTKTLHTVRMQYRAQHKYKYFHGYLWVHPWENLYKQITCLQVPGA